MTTPLTAASRGRATALLALATALVWAAGTLGWWWAALVVGLVDGLLVRGRSRCWTLGVGAGVLGWSLPLVWMSFSSPVGAAARDLSSLMGYSFAATSVLVTLLVGGALGACGTWLGRALRSFAPSPTH